MSCLSVKKVFVFQPDPTDSQPNPEPVEIRAEYVKLIGDIARFYELADIPQHRHIPRVALIKFLRAEYDLGLKNAKDLVDYICEQPGIADYV